MSLHRYVLIYMADGKQITESYDDAQTAYRNTYLAAACCGSAELYRWDEPSGDNEFGEYHLVYVGR